ncbi:contact-dependent growth inhibition system immunity protein [Amycolatopsis sp. NBRC 101858]|uniref:contact-dependent growth inhibition system immunity protein n=1 Tax=Amycolatopsis sp. NBRC 101858 TaxID=3032200 RepID=UPI00255253ED|nr:contact-dependent growth inhibition system immunity protein [Amycolatopsis sp. NBRC 101858]
MSLDQLEGRPWGAPPTDATRLIETAHHLRRKPIGDLDVEDLRLLLLQRVGIELLVPLTLSRLEREPLAEGDYYPGDLLVALLKIPPEHWRRHPDRLRRATSVAAAAERLGSHGPVARQIAAFRAGTA